MDNNITTQGALTHNNDWNNYSQEFPIRYLQESLFDKELPKLLNIYAQTHNIKRALDIGGGVSGTKLLEMFSKEHNITVDLLDPYIKNKPTWIQDKISWENNNIYDIMIARGSINYLTLSQLNKLKTMLSNNGILYANTFLNAPNKEWKEREAINKNGEKGIERSRLINNIIEHQIVFPNYKYEHTFFYYSLEQYKQVFKNIKVINYGKNSFLLIIKNE